MNAFDSMGFFIPETIEEGEEYNSSPKEGARGGAGENESSLLGASIR
jgi:hypothetical protein